MEAAAALDRLGGVAEAGQLLRLTTRRRLRRAVRRREIEQPSRGRFVLPTASAAAGRAAELTAVVALRSAAATWGWELKEQPPAPELAVRPDRSIEPGRRAGVRLLWTWLAEDQVINGVTSPLRTVVDCARRLPFDEALVVADSALRSRLVTRADVDGLQVRGAGSAAVRRVLEHADARSANPFESVLRAHCIEVGLEAEPQAPVDLATGVIHPDLVCQSIRVVIEADSWTHHATRKGHARDCARYNLLVLHRWWVLRFTWEQVMHQPAYVRWVLGQLLRRVEPEDQSAALRRSA